MEKENMQEENVQEEGKPQTAEEKIRNFSQAVKDHLQKLAEREMEPKFISIFVKVDPLKPYLSESKIEFKGFSEFEVIGRLQVLLQNIIAQQFKGEKRADDSTEEE